MIAPFKEIKADRHVNHAGRLDRAQAIGRDNAPKLSLRCLAAKQNIFQPRGDLPKNPLCSEAVEKPVDTSDNKTAW